MATPMHVYAEIAARHGKVNPTDEEAVDRFFAEEVPTLSEEVQREIMNELLARDGESPEPLKRSPEA